MQMKLALIFFISALIVTSHQYFHYQPREMPYWLLPYSPQSLIRNYQPNIFYYPRSNPMAIQVSTKGLNKIF
jgi:hypothetical protein